MKMKSTLALAAMFMGLGWPAAAAEKAPQFKVMAGASYKNLQVYFLTGADRVKGIQYLPLDAAMKNGIAKVNETGNVRSLTIENLSGEKNVFINSGDIIKGGRQDRYLANTLVVPPKSGRVSMASFCVESGRWAQRGLESASKFSRSKFSAASLEQRLAAQVHMDQGMLWKQVARSRHMYRVALLRHHGLLNPPASPIPAGSLQTQAEQRSLADAARALQMSTSLQLALENKGLQKITQQYVHHMNGNLSEYSDAVGFVFAINGEIIGADVYGQASLFRALWPKLIYAAATEAMAKLDDKKKLKPLKREHFVAFFANEKQGSPIQRELNAKTLLITIKGDQHILLETRDLRASASWLHRSYLATP